MPSEQIFLRSEKCGSTHRAKCNAGQTACCTESRACQNQPTE